MTTQANPSSVPTNEALSRAIDTAGRQIPPLWPLASHVAVNPYLGQTEHRLATTGALMARVGGGPITMPRSWYKERFDGGEITEADLGASPYDMKPANVAALTAALAGQPEDRAPLPTIADLAAKVSGTTWPDIVADRIGMWAGSYFDVGQALWAAPRRKGAWASYRFYATNDITPEIMGLRGFAAHASDAPTNASAAIERAAGTLGLDAAALEALGHRLLQSMGGWAQYARYHLWPAELADDGDETLTDLLAIRLLWEEALYERFETEIAEDWAAARAVYGTAAVAGADDIVDEILQ